MFQTIFRTVFKTKILFVLWIFVFTLTVFTYAYSSLSSLPQAHMNIRKFNHDRKGYLLKTSGCRIPKMYVNGPDVKNTMDYSTEINCESDWNYTLPLIVSNLTALILNTTAFATLNIDVDDASFKCYYTPIEKAKFSDDELNFGDKVYFTHSTTVPHEMVKVICTLNENILYHGYHIFVRPSSNIHKRQYGDISVLVLGIDAVSRLNFRRHMPKTDELLSRLGSVEMSGYNKVEDNTFPNLIPVLSGFSVEELRNRCWPRDDSFFDDCHFVWDDYKTNKFDTIYLEDTPYISLFNYLKSGFKNQPTDHYFRPIMLDAENNIGHQRHGNVMACSGPKLGMTSVFDYAYKTALSMTNYSYLGFFWSSSLTHDFVEYPRFGDEDLRNFFDELNRSGELANTIVILMSDHGIRWGRYRNTFQGGLEDRLPLLRFIVPEWFQTMHPRAIQNLNRNSVRLTTPYDLHETLLDLANITYLSDDDSIKKRMEVVQGNRGISLFLEIPENRTCQNAGIPKYYCACKDERTKLTVDNIDVVKAADTLVRHVNSVLSIHPRCARLTLREIHNASVERHHTNLNDYEVQVITVPGFAKFEAIIRKENDQFTMVSSVNRLNLYGNQSVCVNTAQLKLLCYCID